MEDNSVVEWSGRDIFQKVISRCIIWMPRYSEHETYFASLSIHNEYTWLCTGLLLHCEEQQRTIDILYSEPVAPY